MLFIKSLLGFISFRWWCGFSEAFPGRRRRRDLARPGRNSCPFLPSLRCNKVQEKWRWWT